MVALLPQEKPVGESAACPLRDSKMIKEGCVEEIFTAQPLNFQVSVWWG